MSSIESPKYTFGLTLEIDEPVGLNREFQSLSISCELVIGDLIIEGPPDYYADDEYSRQKVRYRIDYILHHLQDLSRKLWNESKLAAELDAGHMGSSDVQETLSRWGPDLISQDAATRLPELRGRPSKLDRQTEIDLDRLYDDELKKFQNAKTLFEQFQKNVQSGDWRESLIRMLGPERFEFAERGYMSSDTYDRQPNKVALKYLAHHLGLSERQFERKRSVAKKRREALKRI